MRDEHQGDTWAWTIHLRICFYLEVRNKSLAYLKGRYSKILEIAHKVECLRNPIAHARERAGLFTRESRWLLDVLP